MVQDRKPRTVSASCFQESNQESSRERERDRDRERGGIYDISEEMNVCLWIEFL